MRVIFLVISILCLFACQSNKYNENKQMQAKKEVIQADIDFSNMSVKNGNSKAFLHFASPEAILLRERNYPVIGMSNLMKHMSEPDKPGFILEWEPYRADVAQSGDLGYTFGLWTYSSDSGKKILVRGTYVTIWKKQADGKWKFVLDGGTSNPKISK
jgi:ketosteroid isomerase-like protein